MLVFASFCALPLASSARQTIRPRPTEPTINCGPHTKAHSAHQPRTPALPAVSFLRVHARNNLALALALVFNPGTTPIRRFPVLGSCSGSPQSCSFPKGDNHCPYPMMCIHSANIPQNKAQYDRPEQGCQQALRVSVFVRVDSGWDGLVVWFVWTASSGLRDIHQKISGLLRPCIRRLK